MKKICYWMLFVFIALNFGCSKAVIRADLPKTFPNVQVLMEKLDRKESLAILHRYIDCRDPCRITDNGFDYVYSRAIGSRTEPWYGAGGGRTGTRTTTTYQDELRTLYFQDIQRLEVREKSGDSYQIIMYPQRGWLRYMCYAGKDEVIAALLTLCPNIK